MARSIAQRARNCWPNAARSAAARPGRRSITKGYRLPTRHVIHTVGPVWRGGTRGEPDTACELLSREPETRCRDTAYDSIAFPAISCGIYGYPIPAAARIAVRTVAGFVAGNASIERIVLACFGRDVLEAYQLALRDVRPE